MQTDKFLEIVKLRSLAGQCCRYPFSFTARTTSLLRRASAPLMLGLLLISAQTLAADTVNINQASAVELAQYLSGVGTVKARAIVEYRDTYGPFVSIEQLTEVKGIGERLLDNNRERIQLGTEQARSDTAALNGVNAR